MTGFIFAPLNNAWATDEDSDRFRTILLSLKGNKVDAETVNIISSLVTASLSQYDAIELVTSSDIKSMASLEAEKQSVGCNDETSCLAELAGAMDARYVIFGDVGQLGPLLILGLNLFDAREAKAISRMVVQTKDLGQFPDKLDAGVKKFMKPVIAFSEDIKKKKSINQQVAADSIATPEPTSTIPNVVMSPMDSEAPQTWAWVKIGVGAASLTTSLLSFAWANSQNYEGQLENYTTYRDEVQQGRIPEQSFTQKDYNSMQTSFNRTRLGHGTGAGLMAVGAGLIAWGLVDFVPVEAE
jgi:hypothetical protein